MGPGPPDAVMVDLNADLGEGAPFDREILEVVSSASVACGFHAGDPATMASTARAAADCGVAVGAHPSYDDREGFGRRHQELPRERLVALVAYQVGAMVAAAAVGGTSVRFVKPHGALYNRAAVDPEVAAAVVEATALAGVSAAGGPLALLCPPASHLARSAAASGVPFFAEAFADRRYGPDGSLVSRSHPGSVLTDPLMVAIQAVDLAVRGRVVASDGSEIEVRAHSICLHGDSPGALATALCVRQALEDAGVRIAPFVSL